MRAVALKESQRVPSAIPATDGGLSEREDGDRALLDLGQALRKQGYQFTTITPASHQRVRERTHRRANTLRDIFGWSRSFTQDDLPADMLLNLEQGGALERRGEHFRSAVRFSTLGDLIFVHSAFPTEGADAVFFGPDTYRFARAIAHCVTTLAPRRTMRILDVGAGTGAGGLHAAALLRHVSPTTTLTDINHNALRYSRINATLNRTANVDVVESDLYANVDGSFDLIVSNPPYLVDPLARLYRHGGGEFGSALSLNIVEQGIDRLAPGGRLLLYTGSAIVDGVDHFEQSVRHALSGRGARIAYEEIDPDVFGEELEHPPYDRGDRIAAVAVTIDVQ